MKKILPVALAIAVTGCLGGCSTPAAQDDAAASSSKSDIAQKDLTFTERDMDGGYDEATATKIELSDAGAGITGDGAEADGASVTIGSAGTYVITGEASDASVTVDLADPEGEAQVVLAGTSIRNGDGPAIQVENAGKVYLTLAEGTSNSLSDGDGREKAEEDEPVAAVYAKSALTVNGSGTLEVTGACEDAVYSEGVLTYTGGQIAIDAVEDASLGVDAIKIGGGDITVNAGNDAFHSEYLFYIENGVVNVESCDEGYEAERVFIYGGDSTIVSNDDGVNASESEATQAANEQSGQAQETAQEDMPSDMRGQGGERPADIPDEDGRPEPPQDMKGDGQGGHDGQTPPEAQQEGREPQAAPDAGGNGAPASQTSDVCMLRINGGTLRVDAQGDGLDSNGSIEINGGDIYVSGKSNADDTGLDYDGEGIINGGTAILIGAQAMAQDFSGGEQVHMLERIAGEKGSTIELKDSQGNTIASYTAPKAFEAVTASAPGLASIVVS